MKPSKKTFINAPGWKKICLAIVLYTLILVNFVSAFEFDNSKTYNPEDRSITIKNTFLGLFPTGTVAKVTPLTPHINYVFMGKERLVAEFEIEAYEVYTEGVWDGMEFFNLNVGMKTNRDYKIKYVDKIEESISPLVNYICNKSGKFYGNGTEIEECSNVKQGETISYNKVWKELDAKAELPKGKITIGLFADVLAGDKVEFIPEWFGVKMPEYAIWEDYLDTNLVAWYKLNETSGNPVTAVDSAHGLNALSYNNDFRTGGIIAGAYHYEVNRANNMSLSGLYDVGSNYTVSFWLNMDDTSGGFTPARAIWFTYEADSEPEISVRCSAIDNMIWFRGVGGGYQWNFNNIDIPNGVWKHYVLAKTSDAPGNAKLYINGVLNITDTSVALLSFVARNFIGDNNDALWAPDYDVTGNFSIDEIGIFNKTLNQTEVTQLYNSGAGITYELPVFDLEYPSFINYQDNNGSLLNSGNGLFNVTVADTNGTVLLEINNTNYTASATGSIYNVSVVFIENATYSYKWHSWGNGTLHNYNVSATRDYTINYSDVFPPIISIITPTNDSTINWITQDINYTIAEVGLSGLESCWWSNNSGVTNNSITCGTNITTQTWDEGANYVRVYANDTFGNENFSSVDFTLDTTSPSISVVYPSGDYGFISVPYNVSLNFTVSDAAIGSCWYSTSYNVTNTTIASCDNTTIQVYDRNLAEVVYLYANDTSDNEASSSSTWTLTGINNGQTNNLSTYETAREYFVLNITYNSSIYSSVTANVNYNTTLYSGTKSTVSPDTLFTKILDVPLLNSYGVPENRTFFWNITFANATVSSEYNLEHFNQTVNPLIFQLCNISFTNNTYVNYTFKNENNASTLSAAVTNSNFSFGLSGSSLKRSITFSNTTANPNYPFCFSPSDRSAEVNYIIYYSATGYPQRIFSEIVNYTNSTTQKVLTLLSASDGVTVSFQVINSAEQPLENVFVNVSRDIDGTPTLLTSGYTGADGGISFWLDANYLHTFNFDKTGYALYTTSIFPSQSTYTITLGGAGAANQSDYSIGISYTIKPSGSYLKNNTDYQFNLTLTSNYWEVTEFGFTLRNSSGTALNSTSAATNGGFISSYVNTNNLTSIIMDYYWIINGSYINASRSWVVYDDTFDSGWSISNFFTDLKNYTSDGSLFGLDNFGLTLIIFIVMFLFVGFLSYRFGLTSPAAISAVIFFTVFFFDIGVGIIPSVIDARYAHFITVMTGIIMVGVIFREGLQ